MTEDVWKALAEPRRRAILDALKDGPLSTGDLVEAFSTVDRCTVMKHLEALVKARLVVVVRQGRLRLNYINPAPLVEIVQRWTNSHTLHLAESMARLKHISEENQP